MKRYFGNRECSSCSFNNENKECDFKNRCVTFTKDFKHHADYWISTLDDESDSVLYYPFNEGDDYWTIENGKVIWSCWDDVSEELYDKNPNELYFSSEEDAIKFLNK